MLSVSKFKVLKILTLTSLTQSGSLQRSKLLWFLNLHGALYLLSIGILFNHLYEELREDMSPSTPQKGGKDVMSTSSVGTGSIINNGNNLRPVLTDNFTQDEFHPEQEVPGDDGGEVIKISFKSGQIFNNLMNLVLRFLGFIAFPMKVIHIYESLMSREFCPSSYRWTWNELIFVILICCSFPLQVVEVMGSSTTCMTMMGRSRTPIIHDTKYVLRVIVDVISCFILEAYPVQCLTALLIVFTTVVAMNLQELGIYLESPTTTQNTDDLDDSVVEFRLTNEFPILTQGHHNNFPGFLPKNPHKFPQNQFFFVKTKTKVEIKAGPMMIKHKNGGGDGIQTEHLFQKYFEWFHFWKEAESMTGLATLFIFLHVTVNLCIYSFIGISAYTDKGFSLTSLKFAVQAVISIGTMFCLGNSAEFLMSVGQELEEKILLQYWNENRIRGTDGVQTGEEFSSAAAAAQDSTIEKQLSYLLHHMSQNPICVSALGFFVASRSTLTSVCGVLVTYLVVLIQFKASS